VHPHGCPSLFTLIERDAERCTIETRLARSIEGVSTLSRMPSCFIAVCLPT